MCQPLKPSKVKVMFNNPVQPVVSEVQSVESVPKVKRLFAEEAPKVKTLLDPVVSPPVQKGVKKLFDSGQVRSRIDVNLDQLLALDPSVTEGQFKQIREYIIYFDFKHSDLLREFGSTEQQAYSGFTQKSLEYGQHKDIETVKKGMDKILSILQEISLSSFEKSWIPFVKKEKPLTERIQEIEILVDHIQAKQQSLERILQEIQKTCVALDPYTDKLNACVIAGRYLLTLGQAQLEDAEYEFFLDRVNSLDITRISVLQLKQQLKLQRQLIDKLLQNTYNVVNTLLPAWQQTMGSLLMVQQQNPQEINSVLKLKNEIVELLT